MLALAIPLPAGALTPCFASRRLWTDAAMMATGRRLFAMSGYVPPRPGPGVGQRIEEAIELIEMELRHAITYVNDAVIPQVRKESIGAMRMAADTLHNLADRFERQANAEAASSAGHPTADPPREPHS